MWELFIKSQSLRGDQVFLGKCILLGRRHQRLRRLNPSVVIRSFWGAMVAKTEAEIAAKVSIPPW